MKRREFHNALKIMVAFLVCLVYAVAMVSSRGPLCKQEIQYKFQDRCCPLCHIGSFKIRDCEAMGKETLCELCPLGTYMDEANSADACIRCRQCDEGAGFITVRNCTRKLNTECHCKKGTYAFSSALQICLRCQPCEQGHKTTKPCTHLENTMCAPCPDGEYSDGRNSCLPCLRCEDQHLETEQPCGLESNTQCKKPHNMFLILAMAVALLIFIVILAAVVKKCRAQCNQQTCHANVFHEFLSNRTMLRKTPSRPLIPSSDLKLERQHVCDILEDIEDENFMPLMRRLGVSDRRIEECVYNHMHDRKEQKYQIMSGWIESKGRDAHLSDVLKALQEMGIFKAHNKLVKRFSTGVDVPVMGSAS